MALWLSWGGVLFLMSEVPLYNAERLGWQVVVPGKRGTADLTKLSRLEPPYTLNPKPYNPTP